MQKFLGRFRIGPKITGALLIVLLLTAFVGATGLFYLNQTNRRLADIVDNSAEKVKVAALLSRDLVEVVRAEKNIILAADSAERLQFTQATDDLLAQISQSEASLIPLADTKGQTLLDSFDQHWQAYVALNLQVRELAASGDTAAAVDLSNGAAREAVRLATADLDAFVTKNEADMEAGKLAAANSFAQARNLMLGLTGLAIVAGLALGLVVARSISANLGVMVNAANQISNGDVGQEVAVDSHDETGDLAVAFKRMIAYLKEMAGVAGRVASGDLDVQVAPRSERDALGLAVRKMLADLRQVTRENEQRVWQAGGQVGLSDEMRGVMDVSLLARKVVTYLCRYLDAPIGALYLDDGNGLKLLGSYAYTRRKGLSDYFRLGEGLVGQAALEQQAIQVSSVPDDYIRVQSGLGEAAPGHILVLPFRYEDQVSGVLEVGTFADLDDVQLAFLQSVADSVAIGFHVARSRTRTLELLQHTQQQAEELQAQTEELQSQQEDLRQINEELEEQTRALKESEQELQAQQEELEATNEELTEKTRMLEQQRAAVEQQNSDLHAAQEELERRAEELALASKYKSEFLSNMSHELRTPLNSMLILARMLADNEAGNLASEQVESAQVIYDSGQDLLALINDILDLAKVEAGRMERHLDTVSLAGFLDEMARDFGPMAAKKGLDFQTHLTGDLPAEIHTDRQRLVQIMRNLLSNAYKFTPQGCVTLTISRPEPGSARRAGGQGGQVLDGLVPDRAVAFSVADTGIGIAPEHHQLVFEAFQQVDGSTSREYGGTGLGLSICRELAAFLGGEILLESAPGQGSTFTLIVPEVPPGAHPASAAASLAPRPAPRAVADDRDQVAEGDRVLLIIEDDATFARVLADIAHKKGFKTLYASNGEAGLGLARHYRPTAIVLDLKLPGISGWDVLAAIKDDPDTRHIPVHIISVEERTMDAYRRGAIGYLTKPVAPVDLDRAFGVIETFLERPVKTLLIVEDDATMRRTLVKLVGSDDIECVEAGTAQQALEVLQARPVDCMILDLRLPDMSGFELLDQLEMAKAVRKPPVIVYTGQELTREENDRLLRYVETVIVKGVRSEERLLDETALFLHRVVANLPNGQQQIIRHLHDRDTLFEGKKILLVDDDVRNAFALAKLLTERGLSVEIATDGQKALDMLAARPGVDLVLMDIMLPVMDGLEAIRRIRAQAGYERLPVLALTAKAMKGDREQCLAAGANDYLSKPVDMDRLFSLLRVWLYG
jgi:signal transduction histidine kinase/DNA-binding response OmpR family regulator/HAMP domain-containing protein